MAPAFFRHFNSFRKEPCDVFQSDPFDRLSPEPQTTSEVGMLLSKMNQFTGKFKQVLISIDPIEPRYFIILAICIVVSFLCAAYFVSCNYHGYALRQKQCS